MPDNNYCTHIVVIGGGFAGVAASVNLILATDQPLKITIVDPDKQLGLGVAYRTTLAEHRLNGISSNIGMILGHPDDFMRWVLSTNQPLDWLDPDTPLTEGSAPRMLYGKYIQATLAQTLKDHADRISFTHVQDLAIDLQPLEPEGYNVMLGSGDVLACNHVIVATGVHHKDPATAGFTIDESAKRSSALVPNQWHEKAWHGVEKDRILVILGAGLSALDAVISAEQTGFTGQYFIISRKGLAINPRESLEPCEDFLVYDAHNVHLRSILRQVQIKRRELAARGEPWQTIVPSIRKQVPDLWHGASIKERQRFLRRIRPFWDSALHRSAKPALRKLEALKQSGRVRHIAATIDSIQGSDDCTLKVNIRESGKSCVTAIQADRVISCLGLEFDWHKLTDPLIVNMVTRGLAIPDVLGLGVQADPKSCQLLDSEGRPQTGLYAMGHPLRGVFWESNAVREHLPHASLIVASIVQTLSHENRPAREQASDQPA